MTRYAVVRAGRVEVLSEDVEAIARAIVPGESMEVVPGDVRVGDRWPRPLPVGRPSEGRPRLVRYPEPHDINADIDISITITDHSGDAYNGLE